MQIPLLIFAKAPYAGKVKTRLLSHCSAQQAAEIAEILLEETLRVCKRAWPGKVLIAYWPAGNHPKITRLAEKYKVDVVVQSDGDLGKKMNHGFNSRGYPAAIIGSDAPLIDDSALNEAHRHLNEGNNVIGPSLDGGYYLIGLCESAPQLFNNIAWGSANVLEPTLARAHFHQLKRTSDIDHWEDVLNAAIRIPALKDYLISQQLIEQLSF